MYYLFSFLLYFGLFTNSFSYAPEIRFSPEKLAKNTKIGCDEEKRLKEEAGRLQGKLAKKSRNSLRLRGWFWLTISFFSLGAVIIPLIPVFFIVCSHAVSMILIPFWITATVLSGSVATQGRSLDRLDIISRYIEVNALQEQLWIWGGISMSVGLFVFSIYSFCRACTLLARGYRRRKHVVCL